MKGVWLVLGLAVCGCVTSRQDISDDMPPAPVADAPLAPAVYAWQAAWDDIIAASIERHSPQLLDDKVLPRHDIQPYCPGFAKASRTDKARFWAAFFESVAKYESGFDPAAIYQEGWSDPETADPQLSQGLLQLSYSDRRYHADCHVDRERGNIYDPEVNLSCGVAILRKQIEKRKTLFPGPKPYYWSVLTRDKTKKKVVAHLAARTKDLAFCHSPTTMVTPGYLGGSPTALLLKTQRSKSR